MDWRVHSYIVVEEPGDEVERGVQVLGPHSIVVEQRRSSIGVSTVLHLLDGDRCGAETGDTLPSSVRGELRVHETGDERDVLGRIRDLVQYAGLDLVTPTLVRTVLAGEVPGPGLTGCKLRRQTVRLRYRRDTETLHWLYRKG